MFVQISAGITNGAGKKQERGAAVAPSLRRPPVAIVQCGAVVWAAVNSRRASGGSAMCLDAAVMGTCPTFINQSWKMKKKKKGKGKRVRGDERGGGVRGDAGEEEGERAFWREVVGLNKAGIDVANTAAGVS